MKTLRTFLLVAVLLPALLPAQNTVDVSSYSFSDGVHPTFSFILEGTDLVTLDVEVDQRFAFVVVLHENRRELGASAKLDPGFHAIVERAHGADSGAAAVPVRQILRPLGVCLAQSFFGARLLKFDTTSRMRV